MLKELRIENLAVVESATLEFGPGLNVLSGSTGAGKSLILDGVNLLLGEKAARSSIRAGADRAVASAIFTEMDDATISIAGEFIEAGELHVRRELSRNGRGGAWLGGQSVPVKRLASVVRRLIEPHGQNDQLRFKDPDSHICFLDEYTGVATERARYQTAFDAYRCARAEQVAFEHRVMALRDKEELLQHRLQEIERIGPSIGELVTLSSSLRVMENAEKIYETLSSALEAIYDGDDAAVTTVSAALGQLERIRQLDEKLEGMASLLESSVVSLRECADGMRTFLGGMEFEPEQLASKQERLDVLRSLERRHNMSIDEIVRAQDSWKKELDGLAFEEEERCRLEEALTSARDRLSHAGRALSDRRHAGAERMSKAISAELKNLMMRGARFRVDVSHLCNDDGDAEVHGARVSAFENGIDVVRFLVRTNPGEDEAPLEQIASTGELSRIALAIKRLTGGATGRASLIFDEIDAGVGADLGDVIAEKLLDLGERYQIVCITHMPQIAARGHRHFVVTKESNSSRTTVRVDRVTGDSRRREIARMLGGADGSGHRMALAAELLESAGSQTDSKGMRP